MKSYLNLISISSKVNRKQNRLTLICIILAVFLVTSIFSMADIWISSETEHLISRHGNYHIILNDISESDALILGMRKDVSASSWYSEINVDADNGYYINNRKTVLYGVEDSYIYDIRNFTVEGTYPQYENEVINSGNPVFPNTTNLPGNIDGGLGIWMGYGTAVYHVEVKNTCYHYKH